MGPTTIDSAGNFRRWSALIVLGHFAVVLWHLVLLLKVQPGTFGFAPPLLILVNLIPVAGLVAFARGFPKLAGSMITLPLAIALVIGAYAHFLSPGSDNILNMPPGALRLPFQISAVLLLILEALGCWIGVRMFASMPERRGASGVPV